MAFLIHLDSPAPALTTCVGGDKVAGSVILRSALDEAVGAVQISFFGRAKTKIHRNNGQTSTTYKGRADFFRFTKTLYSGKFTLRANEYIWPFEFAFPDTALQCPQDNSWKPSLGFQCQPGHTIPPTFSASHHGFTSNYESFIEFKLEASLTRPPESYVFFSRGMQADQLLRYSPTRAVESPEPDFRRKTRQFSHASLLLLPENKGRSLTFKEKTRSMLQSSGLPRSSFVVWADMPSVICSGQTVPIFIGLEHLLDKSTAPQPPVITLRSSTVKVVAVTSARAPRAFSFTGDVCDTASDKSYVEAAGGLAIPITERMDLRNYSNNRIARALAPTFSTYNICRHYRLELRLTVRCVDKEFSADFPPQPILVLPQRHIGKEQPVPLRSWKHELLAEERQSTLGDGPSSSLGPPPEEALPRYTPQEAENATAVRPETTKAGTER